MGVEDVGDMDERYGFVGDKGVGEGFGGVVVWMKLETVCCLDTVVCGTVYCG